MLRHRFDSPSSDLGDRPLMVRPTQWEEGHELTEGTTDQAVIRDEADLVDGHFVGVVGFVGGGTGATTAAAARDNLFVYSKADIDARQTAVPITLAQGGTGKTTAAEAVVALETFTREQIQGTVQLTSLQLAVDAPLRSSPATLIKFDASAMVRLGGAGATAVQIDSPLQIPANTAIDTITGGMQLIAASGGVITLAGAGATKLLFNSDLELPTNTWIRGVDGTRVLGVVSPQKMWIAPNRHAHFCQGAASSTVFFQANVTICNGFYGNVVAIAPTSFRVTPPDADGRLNYTRYLGEIEGAVLDIWQKLVELEARL